MPAAGTKRIDHHYSFLLFPSLFGWIGMGCIRTYRGTKLHSDTDDM